LKNSKKKQNDHGSGGKLISQDECAQQAVEIMSYYWKLRKKFCPKQDCKSTVFEGLNDQVNNIDTLVEKVYGDDWEDDLVIENEPLGFCKENDNGKLYSLVTFDWRKFANYNYRRYPYHSYLNYEDAFSHPNLE
jgi:hypothetical protein